MPRISGGLMQPDNTPLRVVGVPTYRDGGIEIEFCTGGEDVYRPDESPLWTKLTRDEALQLAKYLHDLTVGRSVGW